MVPTIFKTQLTDVDSSARDVVGSLRCEAGVWYKYVKLQSHTTVAGVAGDLAIYWEGVTVKGYVNSQCSLDLTDGDAQPIGAGYLMGTVTGTLDTAYYCWLQISGVVTVPGAILGTPVVGSGIMPGTASGGTDKIPTLATGVINQCGIALVTTAANNKIIATCPF